MCELRTGGAYGRVRGGKGVGVGVGVRVNEMHCRE